MALHWEKSGHAELKIFRCNPMSGKRLLYRLCGHEGPMSRIIALMTQVCRSIQVSRSISVLINRQLGNRPVLIELFRSTWSDARHLQIVALTSLLTINFAVIDFGASIVASATALTASSLTQVVFSRLTKVPLDLRSPLITGLSLSLLLRAEEPWMHAVAGVIAISSKFLLRINGKHVFNPAGLAIVVLLLSSSGVWISPGQWGASIWFAALLS